jgi:hypothetical protein
MEVLFPAYMFVCSLDANIKESYVDTSRTSELVLRIKQ